MTALIRSELLALRSLRSTYVIVAGLLLLTVGLTLADLHDIGKSTMDSAAELREPMVAGAGILAAVFVSVMAAVRLGGEYRYDTIGQRLLASPVRRRLLASRLITYAGIGAGLTVLVLAVSAAITVPAVDAKDLTLGLSAADAARLAGEVMLSGALLSAIGVGVGVLTRSQTAAVLTLVGALIGERILAGMLGSLGKFLPTSLVDSLIENHDARLGSGVAALALAALAGAVTVAAALALQRRDVT